MCSKVVTTVITLTYLTVHLTNGAMQPCTKNVEAFQLGMKYLERRCNKRSVGNDLRFPNVKDDIIQLITKYTSLLEVNVKKAVEAYQLAVIRTKDKSEEHCKGVASKNMILYLCSESEQLKERCDPVEVINKMTKSRLQVGDSWKKIKKVSKTIFQRKDHGDLPFLNTEDELGDALEDAGYRKDKCIEEMQTFSSLLFEVQAERDSFLKTGDEEQIEQVQNEARNAAMEYLVYQLCWQTQKFQTEFNFFESTRSINTTMERLKALCTCKDEPDRSDRTKENSIINYDVRASDKDYILKKLERIMTCYEGRGDSPQHVLNVCTFNFAMGGQTSLELNDFSNRTKRGELAALASIKVLLKRRHATLDGVWRRDRFIKAVCASVKTTNIDRFRS